MVLAAVELAELITSLGAVITAIGGAAGLIIWRVAGMRAAQMAHLEGMAVSQRAHEKSNLDRIDEITKRFDQSVRDSRAEQQTVIKAMLEIQRETVEAVGELKAAVQQLAIRVEQLDRPQRERQQHNQQHDPQHSPRPWEGRP